MGHTNLTNLLNMIFGSFKKYLHPNAKAESSHVT